MCSLVRAHAEIILYSQILLDNGALKADKSLGKKINKDGKFKMTAMYINMYDIWHLEKRSMGREHFQKAISHFHEFKMFSQICYKGKLLFYSVINCLVVFIPMWHGRNLKIIYRY